MRDYLLLWPDVRAELHFSSVCVCVCSCYMSLTCHHFAHLGCRTVSPVLAVLKLFRYFSQPYWCTVLPNPIAVSHGTHYINSHTHTHAAITVRNSAHARSSNFSRYASTRRILQLAISRGGIREVLDWSRGTAICSATRWQMWWRWVIRAVCVFLYVLCAPIGSTRAMPVIERCRNMLSEHPRYERYVIWWYDRMETANICR